MRKTDETGICARDCECPRCEAGARPTELERDVARRAYNARRLWLARRAEKEKPAVALRPRAPLPSYSLPRPWTPEEIAEAAQLRAELRAKGPR